MVQLYNNDCLIEMQNIPDKSIDCIITDPPYGIDLKKNYIGNDISIPFDDGFSVMFFIDEYLKHFKRILKDDRSIYIFTRYDVMPYWWIRIKGFFNVKNCIVWSKGGGGTGDLKGNYIGTHEMIIFATTGRHILNGERESNVWNYSKCKLEYHNMQKPIKLLENILLHSTDEGFTVLDSFMGSGSTGVACINTNRNFIGIEKDETYFNIAKKRINESQENYQPELVTV